MLDRLRTVNTMLTLIDEGGLLVDAPDCAIANAHHQEALRLIGLAGREVAKLVGEYQATP